MDAPAFRRDREFESAARFQEVGLEELAYEVEGDAPVRDSQLAAVPSCKGNFLVIVLGAVIEAQRGNDLMDGVGVVERRHGVYAAA